MNAKDLRKFFYFLILAYPWVGSVPVHGARTQLAHGVIRDINNIVDDSDAPRLKFVTTMATGTSRYGIAPNYIKFSYPADWANKEIRIFTDNKDWQGPADQDRSGLISTSTHKHRIPLYWKAFPTKQSAASLQFYPSAESSWNVILDTGNPDFQNKISGTVLPTYPGGVTYVYMGSIVNPGAPKSKYETRLKIDVVNLGSDTKAPSITEDKPNKTQFYISERLLIEATVEEETELKFVRLYHRYKGESSYTISTMTVRQVKTSTMQYHAEHLYPTELRHTGIIQYYMDASDGNNIKTIGTAEEPHQLEIIANGAVQSTPVTGETQTIVVSNGSSPGNITRIVIPAGSVPKDTVLTYRPMPSSSLPPKGSQTTDAAVEFGPSGTVFASPVTITVGYSDTDQNGLVDGSDFDERNMRVFWYDGFEWRNLGGTVDVASNTVSVTISHFSVYGLFPAGDPTAEEVRPKEKIITPNGDGVNDLAQFGVSGSYEIKIFNTFGHEIKKLVNLSVWNGKNEDGETVESGVYLYQVKTTTFRVSGVIGVAR